MSGGGEVKKMKEKEQHKFIDKSDWLRCPHCDKELPVYVWYDERFKTIRVEQR